MKGSSDPPPILFCNPSPIVIACNSTNYRNSNTFLTKSTFSSCVEITCMSNEIGLLPLDNKSFLLIFNNE